MMDTPLPLAEAIGQCVMVGFRGTTPSRQVAKLIERERIGGVILFSRNFASPRQVAELTATLQAIARDAGHPAPLLIATDQENGVVQRLGAVVTQLPGSMALGAIGDVHVTEEVAEVTGRELRALGVNLNLAPVADVNNNPANPVIGVRSFGDNPAQVGLHAAAVVHGHWRAGVATALKHFPGHGDTSTDSHLGLPIVPHTLTRLRAVELAPFQQGIAAGAPIVMTAHVALPALSGSASRPATVSQEVIEGLLRGELGFGGVVMTDCLEMTAVVESLGTAEGAVAALGAGADLVLISHTFRRQLAAIAAIRDAIRKGALPEARVREAAARVMQLKRQLTGIQRAGASTRAGAVAAPAEADPLAIVGSAAHRALGQAAYARSTTLVRDRQRLLPLQHDRVRRVAIVSTAAAARTLNQAIDLAIAPALRTVTELMRSHLGLAPGAVVQVGLRPDLSPAKREQARQRIASADVVVLITLNAHIDADHRAALRDVLPNDVPVIGIAVGNPYDAAALPHVGTYLATYEFTTPALRAAVAVLFGVQPAIGRLPVTLDPQGAATTTTGAETPH